MKTFQRQQANSCQSPASYWHSYKGIIPTLQDQEASVSCFTTPWPYGAFRCSDKPFEDKALGMLLVGHVCAHGWSCWCEKKLFFLKKFFIFNLRGWLHFSNAFQYMFSSDGLPFQYVWNYYNIYCIIIIFISKSIYSIPFPKRNLANLGRHGMNTTWMKWMNSVRTTERLPLVFRAHRASLHIYPQGLGRVWKTVTW